MPPQRVEKRPQFISYRWGGGWQAIGSGMGWQIMPGGFGTISLSMVPCNCEQPKKMTNILSENVILISHIKFGAFKCTTNTKQIKTELRSIFWSRPTLALSHRPGRNHLTTYKLRKRGGKTGQTAKITYPSSPLGKSSLSPNFPSTRNAASKPMH